MTRTACCFFPTRKKQVIVFGECGGEGFSTSGQTIIAKNYLEVYTYDRWSDSTIPNYEEGEVITPTSCTLSDGTTTAPPLLAEVDLIATMDRNQIGTDATIAQHIKTIKDRGYVTVENMHYSPTKLGIALVEAYDVMGFAALSLPKLRAAMEADLSQVVSGRRSHEDVIATYVGSYREIFNEVQSKTTLLVNIVSRWYPASEVSVRVLTPDFSTCGNCGQKGLYRFTVYRYCSCIIIYETKYKKQDNWLSQVTKTSHSSVSRVIFCIHSLRVPSDLRRSTARCAVLKFSMLPVTRIRIK